MCLVSQNSNPAWYRRTVNHFIHLFKLYLRFFFFFASGLSTRSDTCCRGLKNLILHSKWKFTLFPFKFMATHDPVRVTFRVKGCS